MTRRLRVLFAGTPDVAIPTLEALAERHEVVAALTRPPKRRRRRGSEEPSEVALAASALGIDVLEWPTLRTPEATDALRALDLDVAVVVAYGALVPQPLLDLPRMGWLNLHFSLLPAWRGAAPVQWALRHGDDVTGATVFRLTAGLDEGPVLGTMTEQVRPRDTSGALLERLSGAGAPLVLHVLDALSCGTAVAVEQHDDGVSFAPRLSVDDARVSWSAPAHAIDRLVRSLAPAPGAWTELVAPGREPQRVKVGPVRVDAPSGPDGAPHEAADLTPGAMHVSKHAVWVGTGSVPVRLEEVAPAGKAWMPAAAWARGARLEEARLA